MTHDEMIEVLQAHRDGKTLQWWKSKENQWTDWTLREYTTDQLLRGMTITKFRVKPQPRRVFVPAVMTYTTRDGAQRAFPTDDIIEVVEFVE